MIRTVDYTALTEPVNSADVKAFRAAKAGAPGYSSASVVVQIILLVFVFGVFGLVGAIFLGVLAPLGATIARDGDVVLALPLLVVPLLVFAGFVALFVVALRGVLRGSQWERWYRLDRFAAANGLIFSPSDANPQYPGAIFGQGRSRVATDHLRSAADRFLDYGNYRYVTGSGKSQTTHHWSFLALQLDRSLPHMVLDSKANNGLFGGTNLPTVFRKDQVLSLEGDFDQWFTLYCPKEYERDALYVFTPDLMALLIDNAAPFDVEIVDRWMFVYSGTRLDLGQPAVHQRLLRIVDTVGAKTLTQTDRYQDERVPTFAANAVAPQGQRLRRGVSIGAIVTVAVFAVLWIGPLLFDLLFAAFASGR